MVAGPASPARGDSVDRERWENIKVLFQEALERPPEERAGFLDEACVGDAWLRSEVESLLLSHEQAGSFIDHPATGAEEALLEDPGLRPGERIGPYRLLQLLGTGGMGSVYLAVRDDDQYRKKVALKVVKRGMDSAEILRRFRGERQILATLDHPNIARLLDGGITAGGLPYFVMEHVEGEPIHRYCESHRLEIPERLELFRAVCAAVQYAHQHLVVHRDLKPGNILVTSQGVPKLLDFGIAKVLQPDLFPQTVLPTGTGVRLMTPEYASPEQVRGEPITTTSDVYSLGVLLYELLTGRPPYRLPNRVQREIERVICEVEPERPSTAVTQVPDEGSTRMDVPPQTRAQRIGLRKLSRRLEGDLDNIVLMALRKEPQRRYASVEQLAADLQRHLQGLPVVARKDTFIYRAGKFLARHRAALATAALVLLLILGASVTTAWQARIARRQRDLAVKAATSMIYELAEALGRMPGPTQSRLGLLIRAEEIFHEVSDSGQATDRMERLTADSHRVLAQTYRILGDLPRAVQHSEEAERRARSLVERSNVSLDDRAALSSIRTEAGDVLASLGRDREAEAAYAESLALAEANARAPGATPLMRRHLALVLQRKADRSFGSGDLEGAAKLYERSHSILRDLLTVEGEAPDLLSLYATGLERLADLLYARGRVGESCTRYREALAVRRRAQEKSPGDASRVGPLSLALQNAAWCAGEQGDAQLAAGLYEESIAAQRHLLASDPGNQILRSNLIGGLASLGGLFIETKEADRALPPLREATDLARRLQVENPSDPAAGGRAASVAEIFSQALQQAGQLSEAAESLDFSIATLHDLIGRHPDRIDLRRSLGYSLVSRGRLLARLGRRGESLAASRNGLAVREQVAAATGSPEDRQLVADSWYRLALGLRQAGRPDEGRQALQTARKILLDLRATGNLSDDAEGARLLPEIEKELSGLGR
jgi:eukaryotic-like serine/threonine-protein kinase